MFRKQLLLGSVALVMGIGGLVGPAAADVFVFADIFKQKDKTVVENITKTKVVDVIVFADFFLFSAAESEALVNQVNENHFPIVTSLDPDTFLGIDLDAIVEASVTLNSGVTQLNVDVGNMVNQGNVVSVAGSDSTAGPAFTHAQSSAEQRTRFNEVVGLGRLDFANPERDIMVTGSVNGNTGITEVNVNAGDMSNQLNSVAVSVGFTTFVALSETDLGQTTTDNSVTETNTVKRNTVTDSVNGNMGITLVNTQTGNMNNQATVISFAGRVNM